VPDESDHDDASDRALREAATWLARQRVGRLDEAAFVKWRDGSPANALAFCRVVALWRTEVDAIERPVLSARRSPIGLLSRRSVVRAGAVAGVAAMVMGGAFVAPAYAWHSATTGVGESRRILLSDGSAVELNTDSRVSWRFSSGERTFWLEQGEVCLNLRDGAVAMVRGGASPIALSPGLFNLRKRRDALELLIVDGRADVLGEHPRRAIAANRAAAQAVSVSDRTVTARMADTDQVAVSTAWRDHAVLFQEVPLRNAVEDYNRYLSRKIVIADHDLADTLVGGRFESNDPTAFLEAIAIGLNVHVRTTDSGYFLTRGPVSNGNKSFLKNYSG
jgi:transmembrane sensor